MKCVRASTLHLAELFRSNPLMALALLVCLATILWCIFLTRRQRNTLDKLLMGLLGLRAIYQALRILADPGIVRFGGFSGGSHQRPLVPGGGYSESLQHRPLHHEGHLSFAEDNEKPSI
jgi:hypothetical protein